jgi:hypothetical protein
VQIVAPAAENLPCTHASQAALPDTALNVPAKHSVHGPPSGPVYAALQVQLERAVLPVGEELEAGQVVHASVPVVVLYFPASHATHDVADRSGRY